MYFIQDAAGVKVGFCLKDAAERLGELQVGNATPLRLLGHVAGSEAHEGRLHRHFARFRLQGEWFSADILPDVTGILKCSSLAEWLDLRDPRASAVATG